MGKAKLKLLLDTNILIDFLNERDPFYENARLLMILGRMNEFELWVSSSQVTDLVYILTDGGKRSEVQDVLARLRGLRTFVNVFAVSDREVDLMLASAWKDPEDFLLVEVALALRADALVTRNQDDFPRDLVRVVDCDELFDWVRSDLGFDYGDEELFDHGDEEPGAAKEAE